MKPTMRFPILVLCSFILAFILISTPTHAAPSPGSRCVGCHSSTDIMPGLFKQYEKSKHFTHGITCHDCHGAEAEDADAFLHHDAIISLIVSPKDCQKCHPKAVKEFSASQHAQAQTLTEKGSGPAAYSLYHNLAPVNKQRRENSPVNTSGCAPCHGSKIKLNKETKRPTPATWPNSGIGRINPDHSVGSCANCHGPHEFSLAQARQPEACAICHNSLGGDPQVEAYHASRHGLIYFANQDKINLRAKRLVTGLDDLAAPTCATCHMSATQTLPATHNINERLDWSQPLQKMDSLDLSEKCGVHFTGYPHPFKGYPQPTPDSKHQKNMENVCQACHSQSLVKNFAVQFQDGVEFFRKRWLTPGKMCYELGIEVIAPSSPTNPYKLFTHPIDFVWFNMCNKLSKQAYNGLAMSSAGMSLAGDVSLASAWETEFIPALDTIVSEHCNQESVCPEGEKGSACREEQKKSACSKLKAALKNNCQ